MRQEYITPVMEIYEVMYENIVCDSTDDSTDLDFSGAGDGDFE